ILLLALISSFTIVSYIGIKRNAIEIATDRLSTVSGQLASMLEQSSRMMVTRTRAVAEKEELKTILLSNGDSSYAEALKELEKLKIDSVAPMVALLNTNREVKLASTKKGFAIKADINSAFHDALLSPEQSTIGHFTRIADSVYFPIIATIYDSKNPIG